MSDHATPTSGSLNLNNFNRYRRSRTADGSGPRLDARSVDFWIESPHPRQLSKRHFFPRRGAQSSPCNCSALDPYFPSPFPRPWSLGSRPIRAGSRSPVDTKLLSPQFSLGLSLYGLAIEEIWTNSLASSFHIQVNNSLPFPSLFFFLSLSRTPKSHFLIWRWCRGSGIWRPYALLLLPAEAPSGLLAEAIWSHFWAGSFLPMVQPPENECFSFFKMLSWRLHATCLFFVVCRVAEQQANPHAAQFVETLRQHLPFVASLWFL